MENNLYPAEVRYVVAILNPNNNFGEFGYRITAPTEAPDYHRYDDAKQWIEDYGKRQTDYTILEIFRKK